MSGMRSNCNIFSKKRPLKVIAIITLWSFLFSSIGSSISLQEAWAARTPLELSHTDSNRPGSPMATVKDLDIETFTLPHLLGHVKNVCNVNPNKVVIHIQDAHCNYSCQQSIKGIIDYLNKEYGVDLAVLEGGAGNYDLSVFTNIENKPLREKVADYFVKEGRVNGAEFFAINNPERITLKGLEEPELYIKNLQVYRESLLYKAETDKILSILDHYLSNLKRHIYSEKLKEFELERTAYSDERNELNKYLDYLTTLSKELNIDISRNKNLYKLIEIIEQEKDIDFNIANSERENLISELTKRLSKSEIETLVNRSLLFKKGDIKQTEFYSYLFRKAKTIDVAIDTAYPNLLSYKKYIDTYDSIDNWVLFSEIENLESSIIEKLCENTAQKKLYTLSKNLSLLKGLFNISLTTNQYRYYQQNQRYLDVDRFLSFISEEAPVYKIKTNISNDVKVLDVYRQRIEKFYKFAFKRDNAFIKNITSYSKDKDILIVVSGGFHAENLQDLLRDNGYSYISILPNFKSTNEYDCPYFKLLAGKETALDEFISKTLLYTTQNSSIAINSLFSQMGIVDIRERNRISLKTQLLQAVLDNRPFTIKTKWGWDIVISSGDVSQDANEVFGADAEGLGLTAAIYKGQSPGTADVVLVDGTTMDVRQHDVWIDELGAEIGYHIFGERDGEDIEELLDALRDLCGLEPSQIEFIRENIAKDGTCELRVWNDEDRPMPVEGHPGANAIYLSYRTLERGTGHAAVRLLHELGGAYKRGEERRTHQKNDDLNKVFEANETNRLRVLARETIDFAIEGTRIERGEDRDFATEDTRNISYWLDRVEYAGDRELREAVADPLRAQAEIKKLFPSARLYVQNNRRLNRNATCSGRCWFCYARRTPLLKRQKETQPMEISEAVKIIDRAIEMGLTDIQLNGEDTLDDLDSFWAIVDACKDKPIRFSFFSSGFYLLRDQAETLKFFEELKRRLGNVTKISLTLSWDPEKVSRFKKAPIFNDDEDAVLRAMAGVIHSYNQVFPVTGGFSFDAKYSLSVDAHDLGTSSRKQAGKIYDEFHQKLNNYLATDYGHRSDEHLYVYMDYGWLELHTPEAVVEGIQRGRIYRQFTVADLFRRMAARKRSTCEYSPFFDMSMGEMVTCIRRQEYPRRAVIADNFGNTLLEPFFNPRSRHLFFGNRDERAIALVKQLGFAMALNPSLRQQMQVSFEEVEAHIFSNEELMAKIETLYLLEDLLFMLKGWRSVFALKQIPEELLSVLVREDLLTALLTYYSQYLVENDRIPLPTRIIEEFRHSPETAVSQLRTFLTDRLIPELVNKNVVRVASAGDAPEGFSKAADSGPATLPRLKDVGFDPIAQAEQGLSSDSEDERKMGFNLLGTLINEGYDLNKIRDVLVRNLIPARLTEGEQLLTVELLDEWANDWKTKGRNNLSIVVQLVMPFIFEGPDIVRLKALQFIINLDDDKHVLNAEIVRRWFETKSVLFPILDTVTRVKLYRKCLEFNIIDLQTVSAEIASMSVPEQPDELLEEIRNWRERIEPFISLLHGLLISTTGYKKASVAELLGKSVEGRRMVLDSVQGTKSPDEHYLDMLKILTQGDETRAQAVALLNKLPMSFFETESVFIHISHGRLHKSLLRYHKAPETTVMARHIEALGPGSLITGALDSYFAETGRPRQQGSDDENLTCGTICHADHEGSYEALDNQLERQFEKLREILRGAGIVVEGDLNQSHADLALAMLEHPDDAKRQEKMVEQLSLMRERMRTEADVSDSVSIFFSIPEGNTELFWVGGHYGAGHFNRVGTRIHVSLPFINNRGEIAGTSVVDHEKHHIKTQDKNKPLGDHKTITGELEQKLKLAIRDDEMILAKQDIFHVIQYPIQERMVPEDISATAQEMYEELTVSPIINRPCTIGMIVKAEPGDNVDLLLQERFAQEMEILGRRLDKKIQVKRGIIEYEIGKIKYIAYVDDGTESPANLDRLQRFKERLQSQGNPKERTFAWILSNENRLEPRPYIQSLNEVANIVGLNGEYIPISWQMIVGPLFANLIDSKSRPQTNETERINALVRSIIQALSGMTRKDLDELNSTLGEKLRAAAFNDLAALFNGTSLILYLPPIEPVTHTIEEYRKADEEIRASV